MAVDFAVTKSWPQHEGCLSLPVMVTPRGDEKGDRGTTGQLLDGRCGPCDTRIMLAVCQLRAVHIFFEVTAQIELKCAWL